MVFIPGGEFARGRTHKLPDDGLQWWPELLQDDRPVKRLWVDAFYLDTHEVTCQDYARFVKAAKHRAPYNWPKGELPAGKERLPVAAVDWNDASAYCAWAGKRLPTEAEWERAARGLAEGTKYPWGDRNPTKQDACYDTLGGPCEVGKFKANYFGLYDMAGNVWEWTLDWYERRWYEKSPDRNPRGPVDGQYRVIRGGSWADVTKYLTCAHRSWARPLERSPNIGIRCAKDFRTASR
jgi:formylglycine-generating enzyme required for sulfatase activity